jgi:hypothetical protein
MVGLSVVSLSVAVSLDTSADLIGADATLTFILFLGMALLATLGLRFSYYAVQNRRRTRIEAQSRIWQHLQFIGVFGAAYAGLWLLEIVTPIGVPGKNALWLAMTLALVLSLRRISTTAGRGLGDNMGSLDNLVRLAFLAVVGLYLAAAVILGENGVAAVIEGIAGIGFLAYGIYFFRRQVASTRLQGTMLDSLVRHLLPVLTFASVFSIAGLAVAGGIDRTVVLHVQLVFLIMTATTMMTATIKLRQNLAGL